jgi:hypothetical protein
MRTRVWEDTAAMNVVSVLGFLMNDDGDVVGPERTQVLCKLMPSIHTPTHRAILAMLVCTLNDADTQTFYSEKGLRVLNEWLLEIVKKPTSGTASAREKQRVESYSQVRALLRVLDVNVQTDEQRKQNAFLTETLVKLTEFLDNSNPDYAAEWSRLNIFRRHFESACGVSTTVKESRAASSTPTLRVTEPKAPLGNKSSSSAASSSASSTTTSSTASKINPLAVLDYQPKAFLQSKDGAAHAQDDDMDDFLDDDDEDMLMGEEGVITNVTQPAMSASLDAKIRGNGHTMQYGERTHCRHCRRMTAKRCEKCNACVKCAQRDSCSPTTSTTAAPAAAGGLSVSDRNVQVLGSAMDQAIFKAFKSEDFHSVFSLITNGMDVNFQRVESDHSTALMAAAHHGREDAVNKLLNLGANPQLMDSTKVAAWGFAKRRGHTELADKLKKAADEWKG